MENEKGQYAMLIQNNAEMSTVGLMIHISTQACFLILLNLLCCYYLVVITYALSKSKQEKLAKFTKLSFYQ